MPIAYFPAEDVKELVNKIVETLPLRYISKDHVICFRSKGSRSKRGIARCYALSKIWQKALNLPPHYIIEVISERYDSLSEENKIKVIIHELLHIPRAFGGGLRPHQGYVTKKVVEEHYCRYVAMVNRRRSSI